MSIFKPMVLLAGDLEFIESNYSDLYALIQPDISHDQLHVAIHSQKQWDEIENLFVDCIAGSATDDGELTENGLRLEHILDYA